MLIDDKSFFHIPVEETYKKIMKMKRNNDYTTGNLMDYEYFSKHYELIAIDLSMQIQLENTGTMQQTNFNDKLDRDDGTTMFFIMKKSKETTFNFSATPVDIVLNGNSKKS